MLKGMEENNEHTIRLVGLSLHREELTSWEREEIPWTRVSCIVSRVEAGNDDVLHKIKSTIYSPCAFLSLLRNYIINISWFDLLRGVGKISCSSARCFLFSLWLLNVDNAWFDAFNGHLKLLPAHFCPSIFPAGYVRTSLCAEGRKKGL